MWGVQGDDVAEGYLLCVCAQNSVSRLDLSHISRQIGGGQSSQKLWVTGSAEMSREVRVMSECQRAPREPGMAKWFQVGYQELTGLTIANKHGHTHTHFLHLSGVCGMYKGDGWSKFYPMSAPPLKAQRHAVLLQRGLPLASPTVQTI